VSERLAREYPFCSGGPDELSAPQWLLILAGILLGCASLVIAAPLTDHPLGRFVPSLLFCAAPLVALAVATPRYWTRLFRPLGLRDIAWMTGIALASLVVTGTLAFFLADPIEATANPAVAGLAEVDTPDRIAFFVNSVPQLLGEELFTILPLLGLLWLLTRRLGMPRRPAILAAWLITSLAFGLLHLPTYDWNPVQSLAFIGSARLVLTLAYLATGNLWVSTGAHLVNDWILFGITLVVP
jgi:membrane protease YdiL (CAAX protease family)